ncbi:hypothetical protein I4U23_003024 [Adineta vaga]|nr:hypothetical protein I4U23_003024 [Adineta vaga]
MNAVNRLDLLLSDAFKIPSIDFSQGISCQETSVQPSTKSIYSEHESYPLTVLPSVLTNAVPLPPRRSSSSMKHHRRRYRIDSTDKQNADQPLLNSSTLDDLFRALTLECEQYIAAAPSYQNKTYGEIIIPSSFDKQTAVESNDDDYENLHPPRPSQPIKTSISPLKTSIEVISPIKRHVVSITVSSKVTSSPSTIVPAKPPSNLTTSTMIPNICRSSDEESTNISSSNTNRKRRRRTRKQFISSSTTRSSSSSTERKEKTIEKKLPPSKRSSSTDPRYHHSRNSSDTHSTSFPSSHKQCPKRPHRRDVSLQHSRRYHETNSSPLSVLLTSTKPSSDFLTNSQQRRSRLESVDHKPPVLFYRPSLTRNNNHHHHHHQNKSNNSNTNNIPTHRIPSYPVY